VPADEVTSDAAVLTVDAVPDFPSPSNIVLLYDRTAASPVSLYAAAALTTYNYTGSGDTTINHAQGVCLYNGESVEISGCTGDAALLNGTHTVVTSASNTLTIATPLGLSPTVGTISIPGTPLFNPVLRWVSQVNDQSGNGYHATAASRANAIRWDTSALRFYFPITVNHNMTITDATALRDEIADLPGVFAVVGSHNISSGTGYFLGNATGTRSLAMLFATDTIFRGETAGSTLSYTNAGINDGARRLWVFNYTGSARALYMDSVGSSVASDASASLPSTTATVNVFGRSSSSLLRGTADLAVIYANEDLTGTGELSALKAAIDARVAAYPGM
jgi:hypothetical protein